MLEIIINLILAFLIIQFVLVWRSGAPYIPTNSKDLYFILEQVQFKPNQIFYDLGSGPGNILYHISKKYECICVGIEKTWFFYLLSKILFLGRKNVKIKLGDALTYPLDKADVVFTFLMPDLIERLSSNIVSRMKPNAIFISYVFKPKLPNLKELILPSGRCAFIFRKGFNSLNPFSISNETDKEDWKNISNINLRKDY